MDVSKRESLGLKLFWFSRFKFKSSEPFLAYYISEFIAERKGAM